MAAGQQKKRMNASSVRRFSLHEGCRGKKTRKLDSSDVVLHMTSRVSLEWNDSQNKAVAKREQIGITWRDMATFLDPVPQLQSCLADVFSVPQEIFGLESVTEVLSYEVWETSLSEQEKKLLIQFLPRGVDVDDVVQSVLAGENLHFGNPVCKWGASLCVGNIHPDAVVHREQQFRANRNAYFMELKKYHNKIIEKLSKLRERWINCKNPEKDFEQKILRNGITKSNQLVALEKDEVLTCTDEEEQLHNSDICYGDAKYMSYLKISRWQYQLVSSIKHSGDGIQSKALKCVLGDIKCFNIQPYSAFEKEERRRLQEHWLQLANKDIPAAFGNLKERLFLLHKWRKSLQDELAEKKRWMLEKDDKESLRWSSPEQVDDRESEEDFGFDVQEEGCVQPACHFTDCHHLERNSSPDSYQELNPSFPDQEEKLNISESKTNHPMHRYHDDYNEEKEPSINGQEHEPSVDEDVSKSAAEKATSSLVLSKFTGCEDADEDIMHSKASSSTDGHHQESVPSLGSHSGLCSVGVYGDEDKIRCTGSAPVVWQFLGSMTSTGDVVEAKAGQAVPCPKDIWQKGSNEHSYCCPTSESQEYLSTGELTLQQPQAMGKRSVRLIDLEAQMVDQEDSESVALRVDNRATMFSSYANQDHNLLLPPFPKEQGTLSSFMHGHLNGLKQSEFHFMLTDDGLTQRSQFPLQFQTQQEPLLEQNQSRDRDVYMHQILNRSMSSGGRYSSPAHFPSGGSQEWSRIEPPIGGGFPGHNWLHGENHSHTGWSSAESAGSVGRFIGDTGSIDGSLFGVLSECNKLLSNSPYVAASSEQFSPGVNFVYPPLLSNTSSRDSAALKVNGMGWINSHQNPGLPEALRKPYLQPWEQ